MDPLANIAEQREIAREILAEDDAIDTNPEAARLAELVTALDEWRQGVGFDPYAVEADGDDGAQAPTHAVKGTITLPDGSTSEFVIDPETGWQQWGASTGRLGQTSDLITAMAEAVREHFPPNTSRED